jgi:plastocyanin
VTRDRNDPPVIYVRSGTTVEFQNIEGSPHRVAIYDQGLSKNGSNNLTTLRDITYTPGVPPSAIDDPVGRLYPAVGPLPANWAGASVSFTFTTPGQYLVICAFRPHLENFGQSTFVIVDETVP